MSEPDEYALSQRGRVAQWMIPRSCRRPWSRWHAELTYGNPTFRRALRERMTPPKRSVTKTGCSTCVRTWRCLSTTRQPRQAREHLAASLYYQKTDRSAPSREASMTGTWTGSRAIRRAEAGYREALNLIEALATSDSRCCTEPRHHLRETGRPVEARPVEQCQHARRSHVFPVSRGPPSVWPLCTRTQSLHTEASLMQDESYRRDRIR